MKKRKKRRSYIIKKISEEDHIRFRERTVKSEKGRGRKDRPRNRDDWQEPFDNVA